MLNKSLRRCKTTVNGNGMLMRKRLLTSYWGGGDHRMQSCCWSLYLSTITVHVAIATGTMIAVIASIVAVVSVKHQQQSPILAQCTCRYINSTITPVILPSLLQQLASMPSRSQYKYVEGGRPVSSSTNLKEYHNYRWCLLHPPLLEDTNTGGSIEAAL